MDDLRSIVERARTGDRSAFAEAAGRSRPALGECSFAVRGVRGGRFIRSDANGDGETDISDPIEILAWRFLGSGAPDCEAAADTNRSGDVDISDAIYELSHLFSGGPAPPPPYPDCGFDPQIDPGACARSTCE